MDSEVHLMLLKIIVHKIQLSVRFPCSLTFQLKVQNKSIDCRGTYELVKGTCSPEQTLRIQVEMQKKEDETYLEKQAKIIIYMSSANGKIPAGSVTLNLGSLKSGSSDIRTSNIQKCPDKSANLNFTYNLDFLRSYNRSNSNNKQGLSYGKLQQSIVSSSSRIRFSASPTFENIRSSGKINHDRKTSNHSSAYQLVSKNVAERDFQSDDKKLSRVQIVDDEDETENKYNNLQKQKSEHARQMSRIQKQFNRKQMQQKTQAEEHYNRIRNQLNQISIQNEGLRQKVRMYERRDKQQCQSIKQLRQQIQRKKQKTYQQQFIRMESQSILEERQKLIKQMQVQLKTYEEEISDLKMSISTQQKRLQFKEVNLKEQIDKLNQKYQQSQLERQKAVIQLNAMLEELEASEKKHQLIIKEKDKLQAEEKNKLNKKCELLSRQIEQQKEEIDEKSVHITDLQREIKMLNSKISDYQAEGSQMKVNRQNISYQLDKEKQKVQAMSKQIQKYQEMQRQFGQHKKKYLQLEQSELSNKKTIENCNKTLQQLNNKIKQFEEQVASKSQQISSLMTKIFNLSNQVEAYKKDEQNYNRQAETLSITNLNAANKIEELKSKLEHLQFNYNELQTQSEEQISYMIKTKQYLESELEEFKWNCEKYKQTCQQMTAKNKSLSNQMLELNKRIMELQEKNSKQQQSIADCKSTISIGVQEKQLLLIKEKDLQDKMKQKNDELYELNKKISKIQRQLYMVSQKLKHTQKFYSQKLETEQGSNKTKQTKLSETLELVNKLQIDIIEKEQTINSLQSSYTKLALQCEYAKEQLKGSKAESAGLEKNIFELNEQISILNDKLNNTVSTLQQQKLSKNQLIQNFNKKVKQFEDFKASNSSALEQLFLQIGKDLSPTSTSTQFALLSFPEEKHSSMQVQAFKKRIIILQRYQNQVRSLQTSIKNQQEELAKLKKQHADREQELQSLIQNQKSKYKSVQSDLSLEKQELLEKIVSLEDRVFQLKSQSEKISVENDENKAIIVDQECYINELNFQTQNLKNQIKILEQNLKSLKDQSLKAKSIFQNSLLSTNEENIAQVDKLKKTISEYEKKILGLEKTISEKEDQMDKLKGGIESTGHQKQKMQQKFMELNNRYNDLIQQRKNGLENEKNYEKSIKKSQEKIVQIQSEISILSRKLEQVQIEKKKVQQALSEEQILKAKIIGQLELAQQQAKTLEDVIRDSGDKSKKTVQKNAVQIKKLKQQTVSLTSSLELKNFEISQHQNTIKSLKQSNQQLMQQIQSRKQQQIGLVNRIEELKNTNILISQELEATRTDKAELQTQLRVAKQTLINLQEMLNQNQTNSQALSLKDKQIAKIKEELISKQKVYEKSIQESKAQLNQAKKELGAKSQRQEEYKKKIRQIESQMENQRYDAESQKRNWQQSADNERKKLIYELEGVKQENKLLAEQFQFQRQQMNHQLDQAAQEIIQLKQLLHEHQIRMQNNSASNAEQTQKIRSLEQQLKMCKQQWNRQKLAYVPTQKQLKEIEGEIARYQKYAVELEKKNKQLTQLAKKRLAEQPKTACGDLLRQINTILLRNKSKILSRVGDREREQVIAEFKQIHQKLQGAIKSYHLLK